jgi:hypothetical protein
MGVEFFAFIAIDIIPWIYGPTWNFFVRAIYRVRMRFLGRGPITCAIFISTDASGAPICGALVIIVILSVVIMSSRRGGIGMVIGRSRSLAPTSLVVVSLQGIWFP